jgi:hypothetical protein
LHEKYAKDGVVAVSVSLDDAKDDAALDAVLKFLVKNNAGFTNLILNESQEFWQQKFKMDGPPAVFVFNREGKWTQFVGAEHYPEVDKLVAEFLKGGS